jgi:hypothetical protein
MPPKAERVPLIVAPVEIFPTATRRGAFSPLGVYFVTSRKVNINTRCMSSEGPAYLCARMGDQGVSAMRSKILFVLIAFSVIGVPSAGMAGGHSGGGGWRWRR